MTRRDGTAGDWTGSSDHYQGYEQEEKHRRRAERKYGIEPERCAICGGRLDETTIHGVCPWCGRPTMKQRIQEIRELEKAATPGPWERVDDILCLEKSKALCCTWPNFASKDDWILVQALRNNILAILDNNERLRAENAQLQRERDAAMAMITTLETNARNGVFPPSPCEHCKKQNASCSTGGSVCKEFKWNGPQEVEHG